MELRDQVMPFFDREIAEPLHREIERHGVRLELGRGLAAVETSDASVTGVTLTDGTPIPAALVMLGIGVRPNVELAAQARLTLGASGGIATDGVMRTSDPDIYAVGDAAEYCYGPTGERTRVPLAGIANRTGRLVGEHAAGGSSRRPPAAWGTSVVRAFSYAAGITGLSLGAARKAGLAASAAHIVSCKSGQGAYVATRILTQHGFERVFNLSGAAAMRDFALNRRSGAEPRTLVDLPRPEHLADPSRS